MKNKLKKMSFWRLKVKKNTQGWKMVLVLCVLIFSGCSSYAHEKTPYIITGKINMDAENSEICSIDFDFINKSDRNVNEFTLVFYLFDSDGEPVSIGKSNIVLSIKDEILANESLEKSVSLDRFFSYVSDEVYSLDYLYVSQIKYDDGFIWQDPFGTLAF